jgi:hypothetical protein
MFSGKTTIAKAVDDYTVTGKNMSCFCIKTFRNATIIVKM